MALVNVVNLRKSFPIGFWRKKSEVLSSVSFEIKKNRITGFIGSNGSGKTTVIKCMLGFLYPSEGHITYFDGEKLTSKVKEKIGFLPERPYFYEFLSGREFLSFHANLSTKKVTSTYIDQVLNDVGLIHASEKKLRAYSKGMLQRIGIAQALIHKPEFLILDEPMSGLDPDGRIDVKNIIRKAAQSGVTIFFSSHLLHDAQELCDDLVILHDGKSIFHGSLDEVMKSQLIKFKIVYNKKGSLKKDLECFFDKEEEVNVKLIQLIQDGYDIKEVKQDKSHLEDIFKEFRNKCIEKGLS